MNPHNSSQSSSTLSSSPPQASIYTATMDKLTEMVTTLAISDHNNTLSSSQISQIGEQLKIAFPSGLHTPNHPPYPAMIYKAITELNEECGSTEESISETIKANYKDLPFAHKSFLSLHLKKLCEKGFILFTFGERYVFPDLIALQVGKKRRPVKRKHVLSATTPTSEANGFRNGGISVRKRNRAKRGLVFEVENARKELRNVVSTKKTRPPSKPLVKKKKKDMMKQMINVLSEVPDEEKPKGNQIIEYKEKKDPSCLQSLLQTRFFTECEVHSDDQHNKCNSFCLDCMNGALCNSCRTSHKGHNLIRINHSVWENAVFAHQVQMCIDTSGVQTHTMPKRRALLSLKRTAQTRHRKHFTAVCSTCKRHLPESFKFCSLYCKFLHDLASDVPSVTS